MYTQERRSSVVSKSKTGKVKNEESDRAIVMLINSPIYFLDWAIIVMDAGNYRLVVSHKGRVDMDKTYDSMKGAKIAFIKSYKYLVFSEGYKPQWSHPYVPYKKWLRAKLESSSIKYN
jgi:hypothetical protein